MEHETITPKELWARMRTGERFELVKKDPVQGEPELDTDYIGKLEDRVKENTERLRCAIADLEKAERYDRYAKWMLIASIGLGLVSVIGWIFGG